jgi:arginyl-tRNA synthetase
VISPQQLLVQRFAPAFAEVAGAPVDPVVRRSQHADYQVDGALSLAARLRRPPATIAAEVLARVDRTWLAGAEVSGPGFINVRLDDALLEAGLAEATVDDRLGVPRADRPDRVVIDYSSPNVAKVMHVGHLRSTVIGDAAARVLSFLGHEVVRANHIGDWGTPFGMLLEHLLERGGSTVEDLSIDDFSAFYQAARRSFDADPDFAERSRRRVVSLQAGDPASRELWRRLVRASERYFLDVYDRLGVTLTGADFRGESTYHDQLPDVIAELTGLGLLRDSGGALCAFPAGFPGRDGEPLPLIVRKRDGGYGYGATDLAAIRYRVRGLGATRLLYVVGTPQHQHLEMVFQTAREAGWLVAPARAEHVDFGQILGADGRKLASREGGAAGLAELLDQAIARAAAIVEAKNPGLGPGERVAVAGAVGIGAVKYADLSNDRGRDYTFDPDRMLATAGETAVYLQYTHARALSVLRRSGQAPGDRIRLTAPAERTLALDLLALPAVVAEVGDSLRFHRLTGQLQNVAGAFTAFYDQCPVLPAAPEIRRSRLALCQLTARTLALGLDLLGIVAPQQL